MNGTRLRCASDKQLICSSDMLAIHSLDRLLVSTPHVALAARRPGLLAGPGSSWGTSSPERNVLAVNVHL